MSVPGIVYILTNEAMPGYVKVGMTEKSVVERIRSLDSTSLPYPFECFYAAKVSDMRLTEKLLHDAFDDNRVRSNREFFTIDPERIRSALRLAEVEEVTPGLEDITTIEENAAIAKSKKSRKRTPLSQLGINPDCILTFTKDPSYTCQVVDDRNVLFKGEVCSLSKAALDVLRELGYDWNTVNGWAYWAYDDVTLSDRLHALKVESQ